MMEYVCNILHGYSSPSCSNNINIALIPKVKNPTVAAEHMPITLCNLLYESVPGALFLRLNMFLPDMVIENHSVFVPRHLIIDNASIAMEIFHTMKYRNRHKCGIIAMKLNISKAYDRVE